MAILINADILDQCGYHSRRKRTEEEQDRLSSMGTALLRPILAAAGVKPRALLVDAAGNPVPRQHQPMHASETNRYLRPMHRPAAHAPLTLQLDARSHVYEISTGTYLGEVDRIPVPVDEVAHDPRYLGLGYALLPAPVEALRIAAPAQAAPGTDLTLDLAITGAQGFHVARVTVQGSDGKPIAHYGRNVPCPDGTGRTILPLAYNDTPGQWKIHVRDVATGVHAEHVLHVTE
jgi:hypothetical protein